MSTDCHESIRLRSKIPASLFTTSDLPWNDRFPAWRESVGIFLDASRPDLSERFNARVEGYLLEDVFLSRCTAGAQKFNRSTTRIAHDSIDHYMIQLFLGGHVEMNHAGDTFRTSPGSLILFDLAETMDTFNSDFDVLSVVVPRRRLAPLLTHPEGLQGARADSNTGAGKLLSNYLVTLFSIAPTLTPAEGSQAAHSLVDLVALAFNGETLRTGDLPELAQRAELLRVQTFIKLHLMRHDLGPGMVAENVGMSRARLYRLFAPVGGIADYIREQRLRRCLADLLSAQHAHRKIADIAYAWGFSDPVYFAKVFRQRFQRTPSQTRDMAKNGYSRVARTGDRLYEQWIIGLA